MGGVVAESTPFVRATQILEDEAADAVTEGMVVQDWLEHHAADCCEPLGVGFCQEQVWPIVGKLSKKAMLWSGCEQIYVPKIGVSDGLVRDMYHKDYKAQIEL